MPASATKMNEAIQDSYVVDASCPTSSIMLPPVPPPIPACGLPPPPPPLGGLRNSLRPESAPSSSRVTPRISDESLAAQFPQQHTPFPKMQMKRLQWNKIPVNRVASSPGNLWIEVAGMFKSHKLNFERMEELFANPGSLAPSCSSVNGSAGTKGRELPAPEGSSCERKPKKIDEINLIDNKRSMNVNIFLRQFRTTNVDLVNCLRSGDSQKLGPERLRSLLKVLPEPEDIQLLSAFAGDRTQLGSAEKFYLELMALPNHKFLTEALLMKEEFSPTIDYVKPAIDAIILSARDIKDNKALHEILYTVLMAGNFLNSGVYSGNAAGFQLQSLLKLSELRANKPRMNLLHFVAQEIETKNPHLIDKLKKLKYLAEASQYSIEALLNDISTLQNRVRTISSHISIADTSFQRQMTDFLEMALSEVEVLELDMRELEELRLELAAYFCEDAQSFKLDDCISTFNTFLKMFHKALEENRERHLQDLRAEERRRLREEQMADKRRSTTSDVSQTARRSPDGSVMASPEVETIDYARQRNGGHEQRRIQISQTMPSFLIDSNQDSSREASPCPGATAPNNRHRKRNSMSNFLKLDSRKMLPQTPGESANAERENELIDVLLKTASAAEDSDRRPGSSGGSFRQRRRSRASIDILDRERAPSPSPFNTSVPHMETGPHTDGRTDAGHDQLDRSQPARSSCPSRITSAQGRMLLLKDALLNQHAAHDAATAADGQTEESGGSCPSDAEVSAKQERENRRLERRRRSNIDSSSSISDGKSVVGEASTSRPASGVTGPAPLKTGSDLNPSRGSSAQESQRLVVPGRQGSETQATDVESQMGKASNLTNGTSDTSATDMFYEDVVKSRTTAARRDAAKIRSLGDHRRWSSELERLGTVAHGGPSPSNSNETDPSGAKLPTADIIVKGASDRNINQTTLGKTTRKAASGDQDTTDPTVPTRKAHLNSLVKQHSIPEQRISAGTKVNSGSQKSIVANADGAQKYDKESKQLRSQSDYRLVTDSEENTEGDQSHSSEASALGAQGLCSQGPNTDGDQQKRWGKVFENEGKGTLHSTPTETHQTLTPDKERVRVDKEREQKDGTKEPLLQSETARPYDDQLSRSAPVDRVSFRKEKLRKLSQLYSPEGDYDDDDLPKRNPTSTNNDHSHPMEEASMRATASATDQQLPSRTPSRESTADQKSDTESFYSTRDEGFDSEGQSLCSASQRTSMSSTAESDIRITPMMTRKEYTAASGVEKDGGDEPDGRESAALLGRTSIDSIVSSGTERAVPSPKPTDVSRKTFSAPPRSLAKTSQKAMFTSSRASHQTDKANATKGFPKAMDSQRPRVQTHSAAATNRILPRIVPSPKNVASTTAVQYRIAKPNMVAVSRTPTPRSESRATKTHPDRTLTGSPAPRPNTTSTAMRKLPPKTETTLKATEAIKRLSPENKSTSHAVNPSIIGERARTTQERSAQSPAFVRGAGVRATVPADVLRENKKAAIESRQVRNIATPTPPRRTTSLLDANNTSAAAQKTSVHAPSHPRKPSASAAGLPAVELPATHIETATNEVRPITRKASSELKMPLSRSDRSKASTRIPDPSARRLSTDQHIGDGRTHSSLSTASGFSRQRQDFKPVATVQTRVINVAARSKLSSAGNTREKSRMPTSKTVSVSSLA